MKNTFLLLTCLCCAGLYAQQFEACRQQIGFGGGSPLIGVHRVSYTLGEVVIGTRPGAVYTVTQGFQQPEICITVEVDVKEVLPDWSLHLFPNPATTHLQLKWEGSGELPSYQLKIVDASGQVLRFQQDQTFLQTQEIDVSGLPVGTYFLQVNLPEHAASQVFSFLIQK